MTRASLLKKFDTKVQSLYDCLYDVKELLDSTEDYELSELGGSLVTQIADALQEGDVSVENIREQISG